MRQTRNPGCDPSIIMAKTPADGYRGNQRKFALNLELLTPTIIGLCLLIYATGCFRQQISHDSRAVSPGCVTCHDALNDIAGPDHPEPEKGDMKYCRTCHGADKNAAPLSGIIHLGHFAISNFSGDCWSCHYMDETSKFRIIGDEKEIAVTENAADKMLPYFKTWGDSTFLDNTHAGAGIDCIGCHGTYFPESGLSLEDCLNCHGSYEDLAKATRGVAPNPHDSHYMDLRCTLCHKGHEDSVLYCNSCHKFDLQVP